MSRKDQTIAYYNDFVTCYEQGMTMVEIAKRNNIRMASGNPRFFKCRDESVSPFICENDIGKKCIKLPVRIYERTFLNNKKANIHSIFLALKLKP